MKPRTVYDKAVQDFTETAQRLARLNEHFRQASFAEFEMLMGVGRWLELSAKPTAAM